MESSLLLGGTRERTRSGGASVGLVGEVMRLKGLCAGLLLC